MSRKPKSNPMTAYYRATLVYMLLATALTVALHDDMLEALLGFVEVGRGFVNVIGRTAIKVLPFAFLLIWILGKKLSIQQVRQVFLAAVAAVMLQVGFLFFKSAIPKIVPFYADPFWAALDRGLLLGQDAWIVAQVITPDWLVAWFPLVYLTTWSLLAYAFPILLVATDANDLRVLRYSWLFLLSWILNGNLLALAGSSVGPIYYDQLLGTQRFAKMHEAFELSGFSSEPIARLQAHLWANSGEMLSFISAFPSMHVVVATIAALYIRERFGRRWLVGDLFLGLILLISVYSGYHYLVDGIASIAVVLALNSWLRRIRLEPAPATP